MKIQEGERFKIGWGFAWFNYESRTIETFPIPFNFVFGLVRKVYIFLQRGFGGKLEANLYNRGYDSGKEAANKDWTRKIGLIILSERERLKK